MKKTSEFVSLSTDHNHRPIGFEVIQYDSGNPGPHVFMQASVHGAELQGNLLIKALMKEIEGHKILAAGKVTLVPFANPWGTTELLGAGTYGRFDPISGKNWNRAYHFLYDEEKFKRFAKETPIDHQTSSKFKSFLKKILEEKINSKKDYGMARADHLTCQLQLQSLEADIFLDLHTAPRAGLYLYAPDFLKKQACDLRFPINLVIPSDFADAGDEAHFSPWVKLQHHFLLEKKTYQIPIESYTLELGGEEIVSLEDAQKQLEHILFYLSKRKVIKEMDLEEKSIGIWQKLDQFKTYFAPFGGLCEYLAKPGQILKKGDTLARISYYNHENLLFESVPITANSPCIVVNHFSTSNIQTGSEIYQVLENPLNY